MGQRVATRDTHKHGEGAGEQTAQKPMLKENLSCGSSRPGQPKLTSQLAKFSDQAWQNLKPTDLCLVDKQKVWLGMHNLTAATEPERPLSACHLPCQFLNGGN